ncbi:MAG TPA: Gfo/Idh/MocA family oxidoreductase, partial [Gemmatimonadaceae bacterium]|nr:Gfo/Idh/MocA family oxidoreductase [Gemmatimonadaceae bacterium]
MTARSHASGTRNFKVALVGCGRISGNHFDALRQVEGLELVAVCDTVEERAREAGERQGVTWYRSYEEMLKAGGCDVVSICTPSGLHAAQGAAAARAGKHVVTEKPMAITLTQA